MRWLFPVVPSPEVTWCRPVRLQRMLVSEVMRHHDFYSELASADWSLRTPQAFKKAKEKHLVLIHGLMQSHFFASLQTQLKAIEARGLLKRERVLSSPQAAVIRVETGAEILNFCANNYLGLANAPQLISAAKEGLDRYGFGMASVRFICGTQSPHKRLEECLSTFLGTEDTILFSSCWDANAAVFEQILGGEDAVISDALNHASIIDGVRLCKAKRYRYENNNSDSLKSCLQDADSAGARFKLIVTDGVFSMDGVIANLQQVCDLAKRFHALVMVDDSHAVGFVGDKGRGSHELHDVMGRVDIITGTLGKALGGASGGYLSGRNEIVALLRQKARPYLFSNSLMPAIAHASLECLRLIEQSDDLRARLRENAEYFRAQMTRAGFTLAGDKHPIIPIMLGDAQLASTFADELLKGGIYVVGFSFPVVPKGQARIRTQISAAHTREHLEQAVAAFTKVGRSLGVIT